MIQELFIKILGRALFLRPMFRLIELTASFENTGKVFARIFWPYTNLIIRSAILSV